MSTWHPAPACPEPEPSEPHPQLQPAWKCWQTKAEPGPESTPKVWGKPRSSPQLQSDFGKPEKPAAHSSSELLVPLLPLCGFIRWGYWTGAVVSPFHTALHPQQSTFCYWSLSDRKEGVLKGTSHSKGIFKILISILYSKVVRNLWTLPKNVIA